MVRFCPGRSGICVDSLIRWIRIFPVDSADLLDVFSV